MRNLIFVLLINLVGCAPAAPDAAKSPARPPGGRVAYPVVEEEYALSKDWSLRLPGKFQKRVEEGNLILWRRGLSICAAVWNNDKHESAAQRLAWIKGQASPERFEAQEAEDGPILRFSYRLDEPRKEGVVYALYGYAIGPASYVQMAVYVDREAEIGAARKIWLSVREHSDSSSH